MTSTSIDDNIEMDASVIELSSSDVFASKSTNVNTLLSSFNFVQLNNTNFDQWSAKARTKIAEYNATHLLFSEPLIDEDLDQRVFLMLWSNISDEVKASLDLPTKNLYHLWQQLESKFVPNVDCNEFMGVHFLRSVAYKKMYNINDYTAQFIQQVRMINRNRTLISDDLAILIFIDSFSKVPKLKSLLLDYLEEYKRSNRFVSLKHILNYANLHFTSQQPTAIHVDDLMEEEEKKTDTHFSDGDPEESSDEHNSPVNYRSRPYYSFANKKRFRPSHDYRW